MNKDFVPVELAKKLKEKGFDCEYPFAMYNKYEQFCPLYSSDKDYFGIDDFDKHACIAPTISQVLKWLRDKKKIHIEIFLYDGKYSYFVKSITQICEDDLFHECLNEDTTEEEYDSYEKASLIGIKYVIYNLI